MATKPETKRQKQHRLFNERTELILKMQGEGLTIVDIAKQLGLSRQRITQHLQLWKASLTEKQKELLKTKGSPAQVSARAYSFLAARNAKAAVRRYLEEWEEAGR